MEYVYIFPSHECSSSLAKRLNFQQDFSLFYFLLKMFLEENGVCSGVSAWVGDGLLLFTQTPCLPDSGVLRGADGSLCASATFSPLVVRRCVNKHPHTHKSLASFGGSFDRKRSSIVIVIGFCTSRWWYLRRKEESSLFLPFFSNTHSNTGPITISHHGGARRQRLFIIYSFRLTLADALRGYNTTDGPCL